MALFREKLTAQRESLILRSLLSRVLLIVWNEHGFRGGIVVHDPRKTAPGDHRLKYFFRIVVGQRVSNILQNSFGIDFFAYLKIGEDDVEEAQLVNLLENLLPVLPASFMKSGVQAQLIERRSLAYPPAQGFPQL